MKKNHRLLAAILATLVIAGGLILDANVSYAEPPPPTTVYVSTAGSDEGDGSELSPFKTIQRAVSAASLSPGGTIDVAAGTYEITSTISLGESVTISGPATGQRPILIGTSVNAVSIFQIDASDVTIRNLELTVSGIFAGYPSGADGLPHEEFRSSLIRIASGKGVSGILIQDNTLYVPWQGGPMSDWNARAITVDDGGSSGTGVMITGNTVYNTRNGIVVRTNNTAKILSNIVYNTKGGIMNYTSDLADAAKRTVKDNSWTSHNEWDIVWNTAYYVPDYQASVLGLSSLNYEAYVVDRRAADAAACAALTGNRSHVFASPTGNKDIHPTRGCAVDPYGTIQQAINAVVPGGTVYLTKGKYFEESQILIQKDLTLLGPKAGMNPNTAPGDRVDDAEEAIIKGQVVLDGGRVTIDGLKFLDDQTGRNFISLYLKGSGRYGVQNCIFNRDTGKSNEELGTLEEKGWMIRAIHIGPASCTAFIERNLFTGSSTNVYRNSSWRSAIWSDGVAEENGVVIAGNVFDTNRTALNLDNRVLKIQVENNKFLNNGTHVSLGGTSALGEGESFAIYGNEFALADTVFNLSNVAPGFRLVATGNRDGNLYDVHTKDGMGTFTDPSDLTTDELFTLESRMWHKGKEGRRGLARILDGTVFVTPEGGSIQQAIDVAAPGDVIEIDAGTYTEAGQLHITKDLSIVGRGAGVTTINTSTSFTGANHTDASAWILVDGGVSFRMSGLTLDGSGQSVMAGILSHGTSTIENCEFKSIASGTYYGMAINLHGADGSTISGCTFSNIGRIGVYTGNGSDSVTIEGNTYTGKGVVDGLDYAFEVGRDGQATIRNNTISANRAVASTDGSTSAGILVTTYFGPANATIEENTITDCTEAIAVGYASNDASVVEIRENIMSGNGLGITNTNPDRAVDATRNYWGTSDSAAIAALVSGNVEYDPWYTDETRLTLASAKPVKNVTQTEWYDTIQEAIDAADTGDVIQLVAGTFDEAFKVEKSVTIKGAGIDQTIIKPSSALLDTNVGHKRDGDMQVVAFVNNTTGVQIQDMTIDGNELGANAVVFWNESSGSLDRVKVTNPREFSIDQTGHGVAVDAGLGKTTVLSVNDCQILNFNKNGIDVVDGNGPTTGGGNITVNVNGGSITGRSDPDYSIAATNVITQNGVMLWEKPGGTVSGSINGTTISGFRYDGDWVACGVLLYVTNGEVTTQGIEFTGCDQYIFLAEGIKDLMADTCTFDGVVPDEASNEQLGAIEDRIAHQMENPAVGVITFKSGTVVVTPKNRAIQAGIDAARAGTDADHPGDTVLVIPHAPGGSYANNVTINKRGVTVASSSKHAATIHGTVTISTDDVTLDGFVIKYFGQVPTEDYSGVYIPSGSGIHVQDNLIDGDGLDPATQLTVGIHTLNGSGGATLSRNEIKNVRRGIYNQGADLVVQDNTISGASDCAVGIDGRPTLMERNTIEDCGIGLEFFGAFAEGDLTIEGNSISGCGTGVWVHDDSSGVVFSSNQILSSTDFDVRTGYGKAVPVVGAAGNYWGGNGPDREKLGSRAVFSPWLDAVGDEQYAVADFTAVYVPATGKAAIKVNIPDIVGNYEYVKVKGATVVPSFPEPTSPDAFLVDLYEGDNIIEISVKDGIGNIYRGSCLAIPKDTVPPVTILTVSRAPDGLNGWYNKTRPTVMLETEENATISYRWTPAGGDPGTVITATGSATMEVPEGENTLHYYSTDASANASEETEKSRSFKVDTEAPNMPPISLFEPAESVVSGGVVNLTSVQFGVAPGEDETVEARVNGAAVTAIDDAYDAALIEGSNNIQARATDLAGNRSDWAFFGLIRDTKGPKININTWQEGLTVAVEVIPSDPNGPPELVEGSSKVKIGTTVGDLQLTDDSGTWKGSFELPGGTVPVPFTVTVAFKDVLDNINTGSYTAAYVNAANGGTVTNDIGDPGVDQTTTTVLVPAGALGSDTTITITEATGSTLTEGTLNLAAPPQEFGPSGTTFQQQIRITFEYDADADETKLGVYYWDEEANGDQGGWVYLGGDISGLDNTISIDTDHFSVYGVFEDAVPPVLEVTNRDALDGSVMKDAKVLVQGTTEAGAQVTVNGVATPVTPTVGNPNLGSFSIQVPISEGSNEITVVATDWAENEATETFTIFRDSVCPLLVTMPVSGNTTRATTVTVSGNAEVGATVTVKLGGVVKAQEVLAEDGLIDISLPGLQPGDNKITVEAVDALGNQAAPVVLHVVVDATKPALTLISPNAGLITGDAAVMVAGETEPGTTVTIDGESVEVNDGGEFARSVALDEGSNMITVKATDAVSNESSTVVLTVVRDNTDPILTVSIVGDTNDGYGDWLVGSPSFSIIATDANGCKVKYSFDGGLNWNTYPGNGVQLPEGEYSLGCWAIDTAENETTGFTDVKVDTLKPVVTVLQHDAAKHLKKGETLTITLYGEYKADYDYTAKAVLGAKVIALTEDRTSKGLYRGTYTVVEGDNLADAVLTAELTDQAGNVSTIAAAERVTLDTTAPSDGSVKINGGAEKTTSRTLYVTIAAQGASKMKVSTSADFAGAEWESVADKKSITVPGVEGKYAVYVKFVDLAGNESIVSASIEYAPPPTQDDEVEPEPGDATLPPIIAGAVSEEVKPETGGTVALADNSAKVEMPVGATTEGVTVTLSPVVDLAQPTTGMVKIGNRVFEIIAETGTGTVVRTFSKPLTLTFTYTEQELSDSGIAEEDLRVFYWDEDANAWIALPTVVDAETGTVSATTDHFTIFALMAKPGMPALQDTRGHWAETYILRLVSLGVVSGHEDGTYRPESEITREQFAKMVVLAAGLQPDAAPILTFADTDQISVWARGYVSAAVKAGIITGLGNSRFGPANLVTRAQAATMIARALRTEASGATVTFADSETIPTWALSAIQIAVEKGIISGFEDNTFRPEQNATRAEAAKMLSRLTVVRLEK